MGRVSFDGVAGDGRGGLQGAVELCVGGHGCGLWWGGGSVVRWCLRGVGPQERAGLRPLGQYNYSNICCSMLILFTQFQRNFCLQ